eukprot:CAMPEP_0183431372 /NCGR_PEP_ID=MMETSP0370-20130417/54773_1 /TAXON_ID=268820 /ORGANISM="Peridinium aciculiferum, Strain PAER-2" /LENGTH=65 /DNA_ID=CAMNT_0025617041 /DNA_START=91 /DNA_END=284 /DNA_ORIENTATION=+
MALCSGCYHNCGWFLQVDRAARIDLQSAVLEQLAAHERKFTPSARRRQKDLACASAALSSTPGRR